MLTRNHEQYLQQAVESVLAQEVDFEIELLIGEDFSTDRTLDLACQLQARFRRIIRLIHADRNVGITPNFLRLACRARGEFVAFLEGDDYWIDPEKLLKQVNLMRSHSQYAWCGGRTQNRMIWLPSQPAYILEDILRRYVIHTSTVMFRRSLLFPYPQFPEIACWDSMLLAHLTNQGLCGFIDSEMSYYRRHDGGVWHNADRGNRVRMSRQCIDALGDYFDHRYDRQLADREAWIYAMEIERELGPGFISFWRGSFALLKDASPRLIRHAPFKLVELWASVIFQPVVGATHWIRRKLGMGNRIRKWLMV